ncbi:hypothetical protein DFP85_10195 [Halomonas ventosae]|uniref:AAA domain-containing protein n=2 Tax=Halomonas ventosae TaxID=229007 RepID=A0A4R6ZWM0_9GAMM|nr:hypothetical protein DFP85_10195 [Halomonas ventosae]
MQGSNLCRGIEFLGICGNNYFQEIKDAMKASVDNFLYNRAGFKAYRCSKSTNHSIVIDLVGPPGIGKTYLIKSLIKNSILTSRRLKVGKEKKECASRARLLSIAANELDDIDILQRKAIKILYDLNMHEFPATVLVDEGLSHQFTNELCLLSELYPDDFRAIMNNRAVINLTASPEMINERIKRRSKTKGQTLSYHKNMTCDELSLFNIEVMGRRAMLIRRMKESGFPGLTIDVDKGLDEIISDINNFILDLQ